MAKASGDTKTLSLLDWQPPQIVTRYEETTVRAASLRARIAHAVSCTLKESRIPRDKISNRMSLWLGEEVKKNMLDAYASEAREEHTIPFLRLLALVHVTGDIRLLQVGAEQFGHSVIDDCYLKWVAIGQLSEKKEELDRELNAARRIASKGTRK